MGRPWLPDMSGGRVPMGGRGSKIGKGHGPQTREGLERCRRSSWKHGHYSAEAKAIRRKARLHVKALRRLIAIAEQIVETAPPPAKDLAQPNCNPGLPRGSTLA